jgi:membrane-associated phospholipid phosphatase
VEAGARYPQRAPARPLLPPAARRAAAAVLAACVAVTAVLGALVAHQTQPGWLDTAIDARLRAGLGGHLTLLHKVALPGSAIPVTVLATALVVACLATHRWRGALLAVIAVPAAEAVTELVLKPLVGRTFRGQLSFPSGHTTGVFVLAAIVAVLLAGPLRPRWRASVRLLLVLAAFLAASATATAMIGMGAHYFTDTVGGAAVAIGVTLATALAIDKLADQRAPAPGMAGRAAALAAERHHLVEAGPQVIGQPAGLGDR